MAIRKIRLYGEEVLRKKCKEVPQVNDRIRLLLKDMADTLHSTENGAALAANQVGILYRLVVIDMGEGLIQLVNPRIVEAAGEQVCEEGCLSLPGQWRSTRRPKRVIVEALNERGEPITLVGEDEMAKCLCHEIDHLDGIFYLDRTV